jgi:hypothetical protein
MAATVTVKALNIKQILCHDFGGFLGDLRVQLKPDFFVKFISNY